MLVSQAVIWRDARAGGKKILQNIGRLEGYQELQGKQNVIRKSQEYYSKRKELHEYLFNDRTPWHVSSFRNNNKVFLKKKVDMKVMYKVATVCTCTTATDQVYTQTESNNWLYVSAAQEMNRNRVCSCFGLCWKFIIAKGWARHGLENALK